MDVIKFTPWGNPNDVVITHLHVKGLLPQIRIANWQQVYEFNVQVYERV